MLALEHFHRSPLLPGHSGGAHIIFAKTLSSSAGATLPGLKLRQDLPGLKPEQITLAAFFALNHRCASCPGTAVEVLLVG